MVAGEDPEATIDEVRRLVSGGVDLVVDATGHPSSFGTALSLLRDGGTLLAEHHERVPFHRAVTHHFDIEDAEQAMQTVLAADGAMKVVIRPAAASG